MVIGRNPQLDQRRRRALRDDRREPMVQNDVGRGSDRPVRRYTPAVAREKQLRITDLIPTRRWTMLVWHLAIATIVVAHAAFASWEQQLRQSGWQVDLSALRLGNTHGIARWTTAIALLTAAGYACLILNFRRHKIDDYRGRYRIWYPVAFGLGLAATLIGSGLSQTARSIVSQLAEAIGLSLNPGWISMTIVTVTAIAVMRLMIEVLPSRASATSLVLTGVCFLGAEWLRATPPSRVPAELVNWSHALLVLASALLLMMTTANFARFVYLDTGRQDEQTVRPRAGKPRAEKTSQPTPADGNDSVSPKRRWQFKLPRLALRPGFGRKKTDSASSAATSATDAPSNAATKAKPTGTGSQKRKPSSSVSEPQAEVSSREPPASASKPIPKPTVKPAVYPSEHDALDDPDESDLDRAARRRLRKEKKKKRRAA